MSNSPDNNGGTTAAAPTDRDDVPIRTGRPSPPKSVWIDLYSLLLLGLLLAYYAVLIVFAGELLRWAFYLWNSGPARLTSMVLMLVLAALLIHTLRHLVYDAIGLVTPLHDVVPEATEGVRLAREQHPRIFLLVEHVGQEVGAPMPDEIRVNHYPETFTVELRRFGISPQRRHVLMLSLPQLEVLSVDELKVILGHELAHFGRGDTRLTVFFSRLLGSLERSIASAQEKWWRFIDPIYWFQRAYRRLFALLSSPVQRHQELRADSISAVVCGGDLAARTLLKDCLLTHQFMAAEASYHPPSPGDNGQDTLFSWFRHRWRDFSPDGQDYLLRRLEAEEKASFWDPDPTISQRVQLMRSFPAKGAPSAQPARELFENFEQLEQEVQEVMYA